jgi:predicted glycoside hydrolase/deacetylase ChbG (UPF0249 family)
MGTTFVVNADDFGLTPEVNRGILAAHAGGIVTSTSVMTNMPWYEAAADAARDYPELGIGLHLCLSEGLPVLPPERVRTLLDSEGRFHSRVVLFERVKAERVDLGEMAAEIGAQAERLQRLGVGVDHWNSHQYVHLHPRILDVIHSVLAPADFPCMRTHRRAYIDGSGWMRGVRLARFYGQMPMRLAKDLYFALQSGRARRRGFVLADGQLTRVPFQAPYAVLTANAPRQAPAGVYEWICHPSVARRPEDKAVMDRPGELALLTDAGLAAELRGSDVRLASFREALLAGRR